MSAIGAAVKAHEMQAVESQNRASFIRGILEHFLIRNALVGTPGFQ